MQGSSNRSVVVVSALLTLIVLAGATAGVAFRNGWLQVAPEAPRADAVDARPQSPDAVVYQMTLEEAYRARDDAYAQLRSLQTAQTQLASRSDGDRSFTAHRDDDDHERGSRRLESRHD